MSCSKEIRIPSDWANVQRKALQEGPDEGLLDFEELVNWMRECGVTDDQCKVQKYVDMLQSVPSVRTQLPVFPNNTLCRVHFKIFTQYFTGLYIDDDLLEWYYPLEVLEEICYEYDQLDKKLLGLFPKIPSTKELKNFLSHLKNEKTISTVIFQMDFVNRVTENALQYEDFPEDAVLDFRRRLSNNILLYLQGVQSEKRRVLEKPSTVLQALWRRVFSGAPLMWMLFGEVPSGSIGKIGEHITLVSELYILDALYCVVINDLYSYHFEKDDVPTAGENFVREMLNQKEVANLTVAAGKVASILNEITKYTYEKVKKFKADYPNSSEIHQLLDDIGYGTIGWYYFHEYVNPRYKECNPKLSNMKDVDKNETKDWLSTKDSYGWNIVKQFLASFDAKAKRLNDAVSGRIPAYGETIN